MAEETEAPEPEVEDEDADLIDEDPPPEQRIPARIIAFNSQNFVARCLGIEGAALKSGNKNAVGISGSYEIEYVPAIMQFRIKWRKRSGSEIVGFIPMTSVSGWEPLQ